MSKSHQSQISASATPQACDHNHHDASAHRLTDTKRLIIALVVIGVFAGVEVAGGIISHSLALLADAGHMVTDFAAIALALGARWLAARPAKADFPYGLKRAQILAAFINALALFALIAWLVFESVHRLANPGTILSGTMLIIAVIGLLANLIAFRALHGGNSQDLNMQGARLHVMGDILGSVAAIVAALVIRFTGWVAIDPLLTMLVCVLIARSAWHLLKESTHVLMQGAPRGLDIAKIGADLEAKFPAIKNVHNVHAWMLTQETPHLSLHAALKSPAEDTIGQAKLLAEMKAFLAEKFDISHTTLQIETGGPCPDGLEHDPDTKADSANRPSGGTFHRASGEMSQRLQVHDRSKTLAS